MGGTSFVVTDVATGAPIEGIVIDFWSTDTTAHVASVVSGSTGRYITSLDPGTYQVSTDNNMGMIDLIWAGIRCYWGSAHDGSCDPMQGSPVEVLADQVTTNIDFVMGGILFEDDFESGDLTAWDE